MWGRVVASVALLLSVLVALPSGRIVAQPEKRLYRIGALTPAWAPNHPAVEGLKDGFKRLGIHEGQDVTFDIRFTAGNVEAFPGAAAALVGAGVDLIFTTNEAATRAAMAATSKIPIVFTGVGDPVAAGLVAEFARPGRNVTGVSGLFTELAPKRLEVLREVVPTLQRVWAIYYADDLQSLAATRKAEEAAPRLKLELVVRPVRTPEELARSLKAIRRADGLIAPDVATLDIPNQILQTSLSARIPVVFGTAFWTDYGALVSYGADYHAQGRQAARLAAKVLRGASPRDLPVEGANKIGLVINLKTAEALGLTIPQSVLIRADRVIQ